MQDKQLLEKIRTKTICDSHFSAYEFVPEFVFLDRALDIETLKQQGKSVSFSTLVQVLTQYTRTLVTQRGGEAIHCIAKKKTRKSKVRGQRNLSAERRRRV